MRTLFISTHLPHSGIPQAGHYIAQQKLQEYEAQGPVKLIAVTNSWEASYRLVFPGNSVVEYLSRYQRAKNVLRSIRLPVRVSNRYSASIHDKIRSACAQFCPDQIHYEYTSSAAYWIPGVKSIWKEQDITFESLRRRARAERNLLKKIFFMQESSRMKRWEVSRAKMMDVIITVTQRDKENLIENGVDPSKILVEVPKGTAYNDPSVKSSKYNLLFFGALNRFENRASVDWFLDYVFPHLIRACPHFKLHIVGGGLKDFNTSRFHESVIFHGFVKDPSAIFSSCRIAVAPIVSGAGIKIKVLDYLASGLKVVATSIGAEGIDSERVMVGDDPQLFASLILDAVQAE